MRSIYTKPEIDVTVIKTKDIVSVNPLSSGQADPINSEGFKLDIAAIKNYNA